MIVVFSGRRPSGPDGVFPDACQGWLTERLDRLLAGLRPRLVVGSGAAGTDLLVVAAAHRAGIRAELVVTEDPEGFVAASVADKGPEWGRRYRDLTRSDDVAVLPLAGAAADDDGFRAVNHEILDHARSVLAAGPAEEELVVLVASAGPREGEDHTEHMAASAEALGHLVLRLDPAAQRTSAPTAFVAMPYGTRADATRQLDSYEADETWGRVLVPALYDRGYRVIRSDVDSRLENIDSKMLSDINRSDLFVGDLATLNPNVFWELGVRHAWTPGGTLLLAPNWVAPPFDVNHVPVHPYERDMKTISDRQAVEAIRTVRTALSDAPDAISSPIWAVFPKLDPVKLPERPAPELAEALTRYTEEISLAADLRDHARLTALAGRLGADGVPEASRAILLEQVGLALVALGAYEEGRTVLAPLTDADPGFLRMRMQQQYALALIHSHAAEPEQRLAHLRDAELRLLALDSRIPNSSETQALLGSAAKQTWLLARRLGHHHEIHLARAIDAYRNGTAADPGDYYPGINAVSLLRIRAQHFAGAPDDLDAARALLPVVRYAVERHPPGPHDVWEHATLGELAFNEHLLGLRTPDDAFDEAAHHYAIAAAAANGQARASMRRQLELYRVAGDPAEAVDRLLAVVGAVGPGGGE